MFSASFTGQAEFISNSSFLWIGHFSVMIVRIGKEKGVLACSIDFLRHENFSMISIAFLDIAVHHFLVDDVV